MKSLTMGYATVAMVLLCLPFTSGSSQQSKFIQTDTDLQLTVTEQVQIGGDMFYWKFNSKKNVIRLFEYSITIQDQYKDRVDFFPQNLSLLIKNVQLNDTGIYTAVVSGQTDEELATYYVTVQEPVSPVLLRVESMSNSSESCNFTVSCTTGSSSVSRSFTCDRHTCEEPHPATPGPALSLLLYLSHMSVICNYSNHVSWTQDTKTYQQICQEAGPKWIPGVIVAVCLAGAVIIVGGFLYRRRQKNKTANTVNIDCEVSKVPPSPQPGPSNADAVVDDPNSTYSLVDPRSGPTLPLNPDDVYAQVNKPSRSSNKT